MMTYLEKTKTLEKEGLTAVQNLKANILFAVQEFLLERKDNEPIEFWDYQKILSLAKGKELDV